VGVISTEKNNSQQAPEEKKSKVGMLAALFVGMSVVGAVLFAHYKGRLPTGTVIDSIRGSFSSDSGSRSSVEKEVVQPRTRSWSGSFRRHPPGGIKPAAIQKDPAFSENYLSKPTLSGLTPPSAGNPVVSKATFDDQSYSVAGDYNIPEEYDFKPSPMPDIYSVQENQREEQEDEFSMPEDYSTINEEFSLYSKSVRTQRKNKNRDTRIRNTRSKPPGRSLNPFDYPLTSSPMTMDSSNGPSTTNTFASPARRGSNSDRASLRMTSPTLDEYGDAWSVDSYSTKSPSLQNAPYRHWNSPNRRSQLDMPPLS
jgi:hypothetical protein